MNWYCAFSSHCLSKLAQTFSKVKSPYNTYCFDVLSASRTFTWLFLVYTHGNAHIHAGHYSIMILFFCAHICISTRCTTKKLCHVLVVDLHQRYALCCTKMAIILRLASHKHCTKIELTSMGSACSYFRVHLLHRDRWWQKEYLSSATL